MIVNANALHIPLADSSVQCCVTSPPYFGLRNYNVPGQLGLEPTPAEYIANMVAVGREVWRVLADDGCFFLNLGDSYAGSGRGKNPNGKQGTSHGTQFDPDNSGYVPDGLKPKDLMMIPARVALALQADGWYLRAEIVWSKPNPMPESVTDRPTRSHEMIYLLTKQARYFYDAEAVKEKSLYPDDDRKGRASEDHKRMPGEKIAGIRPRKNGGGNYSRAYAGAQVNHGGESNRVDTGFRNQRDVWNIEDDEWAQFQEWKSQHSRDQKSVWGIATQPYAGAHYATFPTEIPRRAILAGSRPGDVVLDPFCGSGTTGQVCRELGRRFVGLDLSMKYLLENALPRAERKTAAHVVDKLPLFAEGLV